MGAAASKTTAAAARRPAAQAAPLVIRTNLTLEDLVAMARRPASAAGGASGVQVAGSRSNLQSDLVEMSEDVLHRAERFEEFGRVEYLAEMTKEFESTASSHRPRSSTPTAMPTDRTAAVSTGGVVVEDEMPGRITNAQLRTLLRLHYEEPLEWTPEVLAAKYALDPSVVRNVLRAVGPPKVLPPAGPSEHPLGVWHSPTPAQLGK